jgi:biopolymer transport protein ExbD
MRRRRWWLAALLIMAASGCTGRVVRGMPAPLADGEQSIDDERVQRAFEARPQLPARLRVAYFTYNEDHAEELEAMLKKAPSIASIYRIPPYVVNGQRRFEPVQATPVSVDKLRLAAARARAHVVIVLDYGYQTAFRANPLAAFGVAIVPLFFAPMQDLEAESYLDAYVIDTRNGYFYGQLSAFRTTTERFLTIYSSAEDVIDVQRREMIAQIGKDLRGLLSQQGGGERDERTAGEVAITLPSDTTDPWADAATRTVTVALTLDGKVIVAGERAESLAEFTGRLTELAQAGPMRVLIHADKRLPYGRIVEVMDLVKQVGVTRVALGVKGKEGAPAEPARETESDAESKKISPPPPTPANPYAPPRL